MVLLPWDVLSILPEGGTILETRSSGHHRAYSGQGHRLPLKALATASSLKGFPRVLLSYFALNCPYFIWFFFFCLLPLIHILSLSLYPILFLCIDLNNPSSCSPFFLYRKFQICTNFERIVKCRVYPHEPMNQLQNYFIYIPPTHFPNRSAFKQNRKVWN